MIYGEVRVEVVGSSGAEFSQDGAVWIIRNGERRKATRREALRLRAGFRAALSEPIADLIGLEPE